MTNTIDLTNPAAAARYAVALRRRAAFAQAAADYAADSNNRLAHALRRAKANRLQREARRIDCQLRALRFVDAAFA